MVPVAWADRLGVQFMQLVEMFTPEIVAVIVSGVLVQCVQT
jgi:hypothetical protein